MPLNVNGLKLAEAKRTLYRINAEANDKPEDMLQPAWWKHEAHRLRPHDRIEVVGYDGRWFAEVIVLQVGKGGIGGASVGFIVGPVDLEDSATVGQPIPEYDVAWAGPSDKWRVFRKSDKEIVKTGFESKDAAFVWLAETKVAA